MNDNANIYVNDNSSYNEYAFGFHLYVNNIYGQKKNQPNEKKYYYHKQEKDETKNWLFTIGFTILLFTVENLHSITREILNQTKNCIKQSGIANNSVQINRMI